MASCSDHDACTDDKCVRGECLHTPVPCGDDDPCTVDGCSKATGCTFEPKPCDDNDPCTVDGCTMKDGCVHPALACDDGNPCTDEACVGGACKSTANAGACDDGNPCTIGDTCAQGSCGGGRQTVCGEAKVGSPLSLACPAGMRIAWVQQAAYGKLVSGCPGPVVEANCAVGGVAAWVAGNCVGLGSCQLAGWSSVFGQPCADPNFALAVLVQCAPQAQVKGCDDGDACTRDVCALADGQCQHPKLDGACP